MARRRLLSDMPRVGEWKPLGGDSRLLNSRFVASSFAPGERFVPFVPNGDAVAGADALEILENARRPRDDPVGQLRAGVAVDGGLLVAAQAEVVGVFRDGNRAADQLGDLELFVGEAEFGLSALVGLNVAQIAGVPFVFAVLGAAVADFPRVVVRAEAVAAIRNVPTFVDM